MIFFFKNVFFGFSSVHREHLQSGGPQNGPRAGSQRHRRRAAGGRPRGVSGAAGCDRRRRRPPPTATTTATTTTATATATVGLLVGVDPHQKDFPTRRCLADGPFGRRRRPPRRQRRLSGRIHQLRESSPTPFFFIIIIIFFFFFLENGRIVFFYFRVFGLGRTLRLLWPRSQ